MRHYRLPISKLTDEIRHRMSIFGRKSMLFSELQRSQPPVRPVRNCLQFLVRPGFRDPPIGDNKNPIYMPHSRESVSNDKRSPPLHQRFERFLNQPLALGVQRTRRFVQNENGGILENRA